MTDARWPDLRTFKPGVIPLGPLQMSGVFAGALATLRTHAGVLFGAAFPVMALAQLATVAVTPDPASFPVIRQDATPAEAFAALSEGMSTTLRALPFALLAQLLVAGIATVVVGKAVIGKPVNLAQAWAELRPRLLPLLGLTLVVGLAVAVGIALCVLPGIWLMVLLSLATPALVLEHSGVAQSLTRSRDLVRTAWWSIFVILLVTMLFTLGLGQLVSLPVELLAGAPGDSDYLVLSTIGAVVAGTVTAPITAVVMALVYIDRRMRTDTLAVDLARAAGMAPPEAGPAGAHHPW